MKKIVLFIGILLLLLPVFSCVVNETTGLVTIGNASNVTITNVKVAGTVIANVLAKGAKVDYWYFTNNLSGKISGTGVATPTGDPDYTFKLGYQYNVGIVKNSTTGNVEFSFSNGYKVGGSTGDADFYDNPQN